MNERQEGLHEGDTPEDRLIRFKWTLAGNDSREGEARAEALYSAALLKLDDLLDSHGVSDSHERNIILGGLVPGPYGPYSGGVEFDDWLTQLQLLPVKLLDRELPSLESYTPQYLREVFSTALPERSGHGGECTKSDKEGDGCEKALTCPARVISRVGLRQLGLLVFDLHTYNPSANAVDIQRTETNIDTLSHYLKRYELIDEKTARTVIDEMHRVADDFFIAISKPKHRETD